MKSSYSEKLDKLNRKIKTHYQFLDAQDENMEQMLYTIESCFSKQVTFILLQFSLCEPGLVYFCYYSNCGEFWKLSGHR